MAALFEYRELVDSLVFLFLLLNVFSDLLLIPTHGRNVVPSGPEVFSHEVPSLPQVRSGDMDGTLPLHIADHLSDGVIGRNRHHMWTWSCIKCPSST